MPNNANIMSDAATDIQLTDFIRDIPDFPKPGIIFKDITPLLASPQGFKMAIDQMVVTGTGTLQGQLTTTICYMGIGSCHFC